MPHLVRHLETQNGKFQSVRTFLLPESCNQTSPPGVGHFVGFGGPNVKVTIYPPWWGLYWFLCKAGMTKLEDDLMKLKTKRKETLIMTTRRLVATVVVSPPGESLASAQHGTCAALM